MNNEYIKKYIKIYFKTPIVRLVLLITLIAITISYPENIIYSNDFQWKLYVMNSNWFIFIFVKIPCLFTLVGKIYSDIFLKNEYISRLGNKKSLLKEVNKISILVIMIFILLTSSYTMVYAIIRSNNHFKSVLVPGILINSFIMFIVNCFRALVFMIVFSKIQILLLFSFKNKTVVTFLLFILDVLMLFLAYLDLPIWLEKITPMSLVLENNLFNNIYECCMISFGVLGFIYYLINYISYKKIKNVDILLKR